jgi:inosine-uridine nucleoside N-ribohydrolase
MDQLKETSKTKRSKRWLWSIGAVVAVIGSGLTSAAHAQTQLQPATRVFIDNDFHGPGESSLQALVPLLASRNVVIEGVSVVTGDAWLDEETQHVLRFLEVAGRPEVPVYRGAEMPLVRTQKEMAEWEARFGRIPWKGAWNAPRPGRNRFFHADDPHMIPPSPAGVPKLQAQAEDAAHALIRSIRQHPNEVTIVAAGPLTNIALALRLDPQIATLARGIIIEAFKFDGQAQRLTGNADYATDFNAIFDPEAAHIVLTAPWKSIIATGNAAGTAKITPELLARISSANTPLSRYLTQYARVGLPLWDEMTSAIALDPTLVTREIVGPADVDIAGGLNYGLVRAWKAEDAPPGQLTPVHFVMAIDVDRFVNKFVEDARK